MPFVVSLSNHNGIQTSKMFTLRQAQGERWLKFMEFNR